MSHLMAPLLHNARCFLYFLFSYNAASRILNVAFPDFLVEEAAAHRNLSGVAVAVVIAVLFVLAGLAYIYHRRTSRQVATPSYENPMYYNTESPLSEDKDTKSLVDHMENNE